MSGVPERRRVAGVAAMLVSGSAELVDFLVPLWAGIELGLTASAVGVVVAAEVLVSVLARPWAGRLVDSRARSRVAATGAALYAVSCVGYAVAPSFAALVGAAAVGGAGGAFFWVAIRAVVSESLADDAGTFAALTSSEAFGSWFFWLPAMAVVLPAAGPIGVFMALAVVCGVGAVMLLRLMPARPVVVPVRPGDGRAFARRLAPLLAVRVLTAVAEAGIGLLLLLHLQRDLGLEVWQIALVYLPGGVAMTVLPRFLHRLVERWGRRAGYAVAAVASAVTAAGLALAPGPVGIALLWVLISAAWALVEPVLQAVVAEVSGDRPGRGMALFTNAGLIGAGIGALLAGWVLDVGSWPTACLVFAMVLLAGAALGPLALGRLGVADRPSSGSR